MEEKIDFTSFSKQISPAKLILVSKGQSIEKIRHFYALGARDFGENYLEEAEKKIAALPSDITWHFIGALQSRKIKQIAQLFHVIHSVSRAKELKMLADTGKSLKILFQLNISGEIQKNGTKTAKDIEYLIVQALKYPNLSPIGLMALPNPSDTMSYQQMGEIFCDIRTRYPFMTELSFGTSRDFGLALQHHSTMVRIGELIFGSRE